MIETFNQKILDFLEDSFAGLCLLPTEGRPLTETFKETQKSTSSKVALIDYVCVLPDWGRPLIVETFKQTEKSSFSKVALIGYCLLLPDETFKQFFSFFKIIIQLKYKFKNKNLESLEDSFVGLCPLPNEDIATFE